jgi:hypothetical protein
MSQVTNREIAESFERVADLLEAQDASPFRVRAWRRGAGTLRSLPEPVARLLDDGGREALEALPGIGRSLAAAIAELVRSGRLGMLERLEGRVSPEDLFATLPGIGESLAERIHRELGVDTLEELEVAAHDGRLEALPSFGHRRVQAVRDSLAGILGRAGRRRARAAETQPGARPDVATLLEIDAEYRRAAERGELKRIAPRRFNPSGEAWLPIMHRDRDGWTFHALYSNTARAHEFDRTRDWVVIYYERDGEQGQCTVVTETAGAGRGARVVRGRESECARAREG